MWKLVKEPIVQFFVIGAMLFGMYYLINGNQDLNKTITINDQVMKHILMTNNKMQELSDQQLSELIYSYIRDEALYREALSLGLDKDDIVIKQRLIQKLAFLIEDLNTDGIQPTEKKLKAYYQANITKYQQPPEISFTHVFLSHQQYAQKDALMLLQQLNNKNIAASNASDYGEKPPLKANYIDNTPMDIMFEFGTDFADQLFSLQKNDKWQGPIKSGYGYHLVRIHNKKTAAAQPFDKVQSQVNQSFIVDQLYKRNRNRIDEIIRKYKVQHEVS